MAPLKGTDESWVGRGEGEAERMRIGGAKAVGEVVVKEVESEGEEDGGEEYSGCCLLRSGRSMSRRLSASGSDVKGGPFARLSTEDGEGGKLGKGIGKSHRSRSVCSAVFICCGLAREQSRQYVAVEVRAVDMEEEEEYYAKPPYWKLLVRKVKAQCRPRHKLGPDWLNYDAHSYHMNFDDGCWRENCTSFLYAGENDDSASRERAMHGALTKKFAQECSPDSPGTPHHSPLPVKMVPKEETVPIWQRRHGATPPIKLDLRQRSNPIDD